jgi:carbon dioxide concentrating mechanism protein CcmO
MKLVMAAPQQHPDQFRERALGLVSTQSFPAIVGTADSMVKAAAVTLVGYEMIGAGLCTAIVRGRVSDVRLAVEVGVETARQFGQVISSHVIPRPSPNLEEVLPIGHRLAELTQRNGRSRLGNLAIGLLETRGFPAMVGAADMMLKSADVQLSAYETIGSGLCTAIIRGVVSNVAVAIEAGMHEAERIGELNAVMVVPMPLDDLEQTLPVASCWIEQPLQIPLRLKQTEKVAVELPELQERSNSEDMP